MFTDPTSVAWSDKKRKASAFLDIPRNASAAAVSNALDSDKMVSLHGRCMGHYIREIARQVDNRRDMAMDEDFRDHIQYTAEDVTTLTARGQAVITYNIVQTTLNWLTGSQRRATQDYRILARKKAGLEAAKRKTELLYHVRDVNLSDFEWSDAFLSAVTTGLGWMETGQGQPEDGTIVYERAESWRNMVWDSTCSQYDMQDGRYMVRSKWIDLDEACSLWHNRRGILEHSSRSTIMGASAMDDLGDDAMDAIEREYFMTFGAESAGRYFGSATRDRVRVIEFWFRLMDPNARIMRGGQFNGELYDEWSPGHYGDLTTQAATLVTKPMSVTHCALMTDAGFLDVRPSPYRHNRYPFTPLWGYRRGRDGMPYGLVRGVRDIQRNLNRRMAKATHHLSATRVIVEENAVEDIDILREEAGRPDGVIVHKKGSPPIIETDFDIGEAHVKLMQIDAQMIQSVGGVTDENLGRETNAVSGKAIGRRQDQGQLATSTFFDNLRRSRQIHGTKLIVNVEQFYTEADEIRVTDSRGNPDFKPINDGKAENDIAAFKADFVLSEEDWRASARQAQSEELLNVVDKLAATAPQLVIGILDLVVEGMELPQRDEMVKRIRQLNGQQDPDADPNKPDPETQAMQAAKAEQDAMAKRDALSTIEEREAKTRKAHAEAAKVEISTAGDVVARLKAAMEAAVAIAGAPAVAQATDQILFDAISEAAAAQAAAAAPTAPPPPAPQAPVPAMMGVQP